MQHYKPWVFNDEKKAINKLKKQKIKDSIKTKYCKDNNIKLIRIPYTEFKNIENILKKEIKKD
jgi:uridylate kinase